MATATVKDRRASSGAEDEAKQPKLRDLSPYTVKFEKDAPQEALDLGNYVRECVEASELDPKRSARMLRIEEYRNQYDGEYRLKEETAYSRWYYRSTVANHLDVVLSSVEEGLGNVLQFMDRVLAVKPSESRRLQEYTVRFRMIDAVAEELQTIGRMIDDQLMPDYDVEAEKDKAMEEVDRRLQREAMAQELRMSDAIKNSDLSRWLPDGIRKGGVDGTTIATVEWHNGRSTVRAIDAKHYFPSSSDVSRVEDLTYRVEEDLVTWFDVMSLQESGGKYRNLEFLSRMGTGQARSADEQRQDEEVGHQRQLVRWTFMGNVDFEAMWGDEWKSRLKKCAKIWDWKYDPTKHKPNRTWYGEVLSTGLCVRFEPTPYPFARIPDVVYRWIEPAVPGFWGLSAYDQGVAGTEKLGNLATMLTLGLLHQQLSPNHYMTAQSIADKRSQLAGNKNKMLWTPDRLIEVNAMRAQDATFSDRPSFEAIKTGYEISQGFDFTLMKDTGATASLQGLSQANTATEAQLNLRQGERRQGPKAWRIDEQLTKPIFEMVYLMAQAFDPVLTVRHKLADGSIEIPTDFGAHEFVVRIVQEAASSMVTAQLLNNAAANLKDLTHWRNWMTEMSRHLKSSFGMALIDNEAWDLRTLRIRNQRIQEEINNVMLEKTMADLKKGIMPAMPSDGSGGPPGPGGQPGGSPPPGAGASGQQTGAEGGDRTRNNSSPTSEGNVVGQVGASTVRQANPAAKS